ncbi:MAG TPA: hypothetical protein VGQ59_07890 [Cyclobacteriaceae bacterium]|jgi:hypothetical protein|nr:hypothetical protein [Cyclobacteriaceae bacterium]
MIIEDINSAYSKKINRSRKSTTFFQRIVNFFSRSPTPEKRVKILKKILKTRNLLSIEGVSSLIELYNSDAKKGLSPEIVFGVAGVVFTAFLFPLTPFTQVDSKTVNGPEFSDYLNLLMAITLMILCMLFFLSFVIIQVSKDVSKDHSETIKLLRQIKVELVSKKS